MPTYGNGPIQAQPPGLLSLLGIKNAGRFPDDFGTVLQPTLDLQEWYFQQQLQDFQFASAAQVAGAVGFLSVATVNNLQWLYFDTLTVEANTLTAGDFTAFAPAWRPPSTTITYTPGETIFSRSPAPTVASRAIASARAFWVPPSSQVGLHISQLQLAAGNLVYTVNMRVAVLTS